MKNVTVTITMLSYWHTGSGEGRGGDVDALVARDHTGLPFIPGKTVKGLFREACQTGEENGAIEQGTTVRLFGCPAASGEDSGSLPGSLLFQDARLDEKTRNWLETPAGAGARDGLFASLSSTALDERGQAKPKTLRMVEAAIPVVMETSISGPDENGWLRSLQTAAAIIRSLGSHRHRGLGRCRVTMEGK